MGFPASSANPTANPNPKKKMTVPPNAWYNKYVIPLLSGQALLDAFTQTGSCYHSKQCGFGDTSIS